MSIILALSLRVLGVVAPSSASIRLTPLSPASDCTYTLEGSDQPIFARDLDEQGARIGLNGKVISLSLKSDHESRKVPDRVSPGDQLWESFQGGGAVVNIWRKVTSVGDVTEFKGRLTVSIGQERRSARIKGACSD